MDIRKVKKLMEMLEESSLGEMEIVEGEESIRLSKSSSSTPQIQNVANTIPLNVSSSALLITGSIKPFGPETAILISQ